ncbi:hypothetical protein EV356DRAFT_466327 [Viridothelium virens]|uniref:Rhodopsin domain-containing protein n=1 Tax=Viridothelium virens TaxID=1048519 RepID=A0A6A6H9Y1_VIRVR|nr:hypothetical protein EV356DRAFT_466327 [Viridothelium virens]
MDPTKLSPEMLENYPAMKPPPGKTTDLHNPGKDGSNATQTIIVTAVLTGVTVFVLLLRLWTKLLVVRSPGWDDYTSIGATVGAVAYASLIIYVFSHGFGYHEWNVPLGTLVDLTDYLNAITYIYKPFMLLAKLSLCIFFLNIFGSKRGMRWGIYFAIAYNVILQVTAFFLAIFLCLPGRPSFWTCSNKISVLNVVTSGFNAFIDVYLLILPLIGIAQLQLHQRRKVMLCLVFFTGLLAVVSSILGIAYRVKQNSTKDTSWAFAPEIILVTFELEATIMVGCFPTLPALFKSNHPLSLSSLWSRLESNSSHLFRSSIRKSSNRSQGSSTKPTIQEHTHWAKQSLDSTEVQLVPVHGSQV